MVAPLIISGITRYRSRIVCQSPADQAIETLHDASVLLLHPLAHRVEIDGEQSTVFHDDAAIDDDRLNVAAHGVFRGRDGRIEHRILIVVAGPDQDDVGKFSRHEATDLHLQTCGTCTAAHHLPQHINIAHWGGAMQRRSIQNLLAVYGIMRYLEKVESPARGSTVGAQSDTHVAAY